MSFLFKKAKYQQQSPDPMVSQDREEDGFVFVGETEDEKNTLTPDKAEYHNQDLPPMYQFSEGNQEFNSSQNQQNTSQPTYENMRLPATYENYSAPPCYGQNEKNGQNDVSSSSSNEPRSQGSIKPTVKSSVHDIPFKLDDSVACAFNHGRLNVDIGDNFSFTPSAYDYDFTTERSILQQMDTF